MNVFAGRDHTLHAKVPGEVVFTEIKFPERIRRRVRKLVNIVPPGKHTELIHFTAEKQKSIYDSQAARKVREEITYKKERALL
jgi:hypothetical protein